MPCDFENPEIVEELMAAAATATSASADSPGGASSASAQTPGSSGAADPRTPMLSLASPTLFPMTPLYPQPSPTMSRPAPVDNRLLELRLMHHYTTFTSRTLIVAQAVDDIWQNTVPRMAFTGANHLADAILAVAALHLRALNPGDKDVVRASHAYMASSLSEYLASLNRGINEENAETLFLTATLIAFQSTASRIFLRDEADKESPNQYELPLAWFHAFQGVKTVVATSWGWLRNSNVVVPIIETQPVLHLDLDATAPDSFFGHILEGVDDELAVEDPVLATQTRQTYYHAIAVLNWAHKIPHRGAALVFPATVSKRFIDLVEARRPRALALLACFFALLKSIDQVWWLQGVARREVMGIVSQFEPDSPWWPHLEWPVRIALFDGSVIPPDIWGSDWVAEENKMDRTAEPISFINHIEVLSQLVGQQVLPPVPIPPEVLEQERRRSS